MRTITFVEARSLDFLHRVPTLDNRIPLIAPNPMNLENSRATSTHDAVCSLLLFGPSRWIESLQRFTVCFLYFPTRSGTSPTTRSSPWKNLNVLSCSIKSYKIAFLIKDFQVYPLLIVCIRCGLQRCTFARSVESTRKRSRCSSVTQREDIVSFFRFSFLGESALSLAFYERCEKIGEHRLTFTERGSLLKNRKNSRNAIFHGSPRQTERLRSTDSRDVKGIPPLGRTNSSDANPIRVEQRRAIPFTWDDFSLFLRTRSVAWKWRLSPTDSPRGSVGFWNVDPEEIRILSW